MGYDNRNADRLVFDIETAPLAEAADYLESADAPANYKDPVKIAAFIAEKGREDLDKCSLDVDLCRVVAIGWQRESDVVVQASVISEPELEALALHNFWSQADQLHLVGFNCLSFDLPVLLRRSLYLGVDVPPIQIDRFKHPRVTDLIEVLSFNGAIRKRGLSFYARRFGFPVSDLMTGADMALAVRSGSWNDVKAHVVADVRKTVMLAEKLGYFSRQTAGAF